MAKYSWLVLFIIGMLLTLSSLGILAVEIDRNEFRSSTDIEWDTFKAAQPQAAAYIARLIKLVGAASAGVALFGALVAYKPYRAGERWAWFAMLLYPILYSAYAAIFFSFSAPGLGVYYGALGVITLAALLVGYSNFSGQENLSEL